MNVREERPHVVRRANPLGLLMMPTGAAFLAFLLFRVDLRLGVAVTTSSMGSALWLVLRRQAARERARLLRLCRVGLVVGVLSTAVYDTSKWAFAQLGGVRDSPFGAIPRFGALLLGGEAHPLARTLIGAAFHLTNGVTFAIAFAVVVARPTWRKGIVFALILEAFQLSLYPGWLNPKSVAEFASVSAFGHVAYGATLGTLTRALLERHDGGPTARQVVTPSEE